MAAPESTKFQVNFKAPDGTLINLYAANKEELEALLTAAQDFSALIGSVSQAFGGAPTSAPIHSLPIVGAAPTVAPVGSGNICKHGPMTYKEGVSAKGPWKGYMCTAPKGAVDKCQTIWVR
jgi:hypothetical protein